MIPILYESNETAFLNQGLGALSDAVSVNVSRVLNGKDELVLVYPSDGIRYADIRNDRIIYAQPEYRKSAQPYQIYQITKPLNGLVTIYARHVGMQRAKYIPVTAFTAASAVDVLYQLPQHLAETNPFTFWTNKNTIANFKLTRPASLGNVLGGMEGSILDVYGGEYEFDGYTVRLWDKRGSENGVQLRYGKNITSIEQTEDFAPIITGVCPYWEGMDGGVVVLPEVVVQGAYADSYAFRRTIVKDFTEQFEEAPTVQELRDAATAYISNNSLGVPSINLKVNFEHLAQYTEYEGMALLESVNLGDTIEIYYEPLSVSATARIVNTTYDCLNEKYTSVQVGSVKSNLEQVMNQMTATTKTLKDTLTQSIPSAIAEAVSHATDLITGANGGYVVMNRDADGKPYEILIMDTDDPATAVNVLRLNLNGIGFSTSGYSGPFNTAWTIDGNFVANYITTGTLNANVIRAGILTDALGHNSWNLQTGAFTITDGSINITTNSQTYDAISLAYNEWQLQMSPIQVLSRNTNTKRQIAVQAGGIFGYFDYTSTPASTSLNISSNGSGFFGGGSQNGSLYVLDGNNTTTAYITGSNGTYWGRSLKIGLGSVDGTIDVRNADAATTATIDGADGGIDLETSGQRGRIRIRDASNNVRVYAYGGNGGLYCLDGSGSTEARVALLGSTGEGLFADANQDVRIKIQGADGKIISSSLELGGTSTDVSAAGNLKINRADGTNGMEFNPSLPAMIIKAANGTGYRTALADDGLYFYNASGTQTALYPSGGFAYTTGTAITSNVPSGIDTAVRSLTLSPGKYLLYAIVGYPSNATGRRVTGITTNSTSTVSDAVTYDTRVPISGGVTRASFFGYATPSASTTYYLVCYQNSGSAMTMSPYTLAAIKLP